MKIEIKYIVFELIANTKVKMQDFQFEIEAFNFIKEQKKGTFIIEEIKLYHIVN